MIEDFLQRNNSTFNNILNDSFEQIALPPFSLWNNYTLSPKYSGGYSTVLQNAPFLGTTTDHWITLPLHGYLKSDAKYIGIIQEMFIKKPLESGNIGHNAYIKSVVGNIDYRIFTSVKSLNSGRNLLYIGYINVEDALEYEDLLLCCAIHSNAEHDEIEVQLSGLRLFYIENTEDIDKITIGQYLLDFEAQINDYINQINTTINNLNLENINNGRKTILSNTSYLNASITVIEKDIKDNWFTYRYSGGGNTWAPTKLFYPSGNTPIIISFDVEMMSGGNGSKAGGVLQIGNSFSVNAKYKTLKTFNSDGHIKIEVDTSYLIAHEDFTDGFSIWFNNILIPDYSGAEDYVSYKVSNFEVYENIDGIKSSNISGDNAKQLFESVDDNLTDIKSQLSEFDSTKLISPSGNGYRMAVTDSGEIVAIPLIPNKGAFFGNSLITGFGEYGMAASQATKDWYYLVTEYLKRINSSFVAKPRKGASGFEGLTVTDAETVNGNIQSTFLNNLDGDENLVIVQLGDNVNTAEKNAAFHTTCAMVLKAIRQKCPNARVVWIGMWYASTERYNVIKQACEDTGCEYVFFDGLNDLSAQNAIGGKTYHESSASRSMTGVTEVIENTPTNITVKFTVGENSYETTMDVDSYTPLSGTTLQYVGHYQVIQSGGVASHPGDEGFRRIANRVLYELGYSDVEETYPAE